MTRSILYPARGSDPLAASRGADAVVIGTDWPILAWLRNEVRGVLLFDARNVIDPSAASSAGFAFRGVGRQSVAPSHEPASARTSAGTWAYRPPCVSSAGRVRARILRSSQSVQPSM